MAAGCKLRLSANICIFLCIYVSFVNCKSLYLQKSTSLNVSDVYFVSKGSCRTEIAGNFRQQRNPSGDKELSNSLKAVMFCKLFHRACFALSTISVISVETFYSNTAFFNDFGYLLLKYPLPPFFNVEIQISLPVLLLQH